VVEAHSGKGDHGILSTASQTFTAEEAYYLNYDVSNNPNAKDATRYIKMQGRKIFEFALNHVPAAMKTCLDKSGVSIDEVKKVLIHQANEKMDEAIIKRFFRLYKKREPEGIMPMSIHLLGNSSVATVPTLLDLLRKGELKEHSINKGDVLLLASVGAGMSINAITYRV
jgi:3-oxoacyl-[acyl-carrier-protein] synthase-3